MVNHNIKNSNEEPKNKNMIEEQEKENYSYTFYKGIQQRVKTLKNEIDKRTGKKKLTKKK